MDGRRIFQSAKHRPRREEANIDRCDAVRSWRVGYIYTSNCLIVRDIEHSEYKILLVGEIQSSGNTVFIECAGECVVKNINRTDLKNEID